MFNKNGSNNGAHKDTAIVARNGNGAHNGVENAAVATEHELLWDGLSPAVTNALSQPLDPALVSQRKGRGGRVFDYLEGPRRHRPGQPHLRLRRMGLRAGRRRDAAPDRDRRYPDG